MTNPYRGAMPEPERLALRVDGHLVQADSTEDLLAKLRRLGESIGFKVDDDLTITFDQRRNVTVEQEEPSWPN